MLYFFVALVCVVVGLWIFTPLVRSAAIQPAVPQPPRTAYTALEERRDGVLHSLKELEFDFSTGKVDDEEYAAQRADLTAQASRIFDSLEALSRPVAAPVVASSGSSTGANLTLAERALELEVLVMRARRKKAGWQCAHCERQMRDTDRFCASCGSAREALAAPV